MSRRKESVGDSLELLLDTICNMFGGIVFISLLVIVMLQMSGQRGLRASADDDAEPVSQERLAALAADVERLRLDRDRLQAARTAQIELISRLIPEDYQARLDRWRDAARERSELEREVAGLESSNVDRVGKVSERRKAITTKARQLAGRQRELAALEKELRSIPERPAESLPLAEHRRELSAVQVCLCYDRFYLRHRYVGGEPAGPNLDDYFVSKADDDTLHVHPKPTGGIVIDAGPRGEAEIRQMLRAFSPEEHQINVTVWPDSYDSFRRLRQILAGAGFRYGILACEADNTVADRGGEQRPSQ
ncbi:hypothetical protein [Planctomyces sp. SH-PL14]|uniref:hypothetical protein n=1 Tax=Planctomyces sp. SH-PL14 TaxID=1632864 RepID=UPI00078B8D95|nr:hypothetical protein [Planctomyces sp. SH-PL14]AMV18221.1 hypothetical protein VT03_10055 [Planctomyces sp. SH-PL14]